MTAYQTDAGDHSRDIDALHDHVAADSSSTPPGNRVLDPTSVLARFNGDQNRYTEATGTGTGDFGGARGDLVAIWPKSECRDDRAMCQQSPPGSWGLAGPPDLPLLAPRPVVTAHIGARGRFVTAHPRSRRVRACFGDGHRDLCRLAR